MKIQLKVLNKNFYRGVRPGDASDDIYTEVCKEGVGNLPAYSTSGSAALDLVCTREVVIFPGEVVEIHTGLAIWVGGNEGPFYGYPFQDQMGYAGIIAPRSGLGTKGLILGNTIGIIDEDYQGELIVQAWNRRGSKFENSAPIQESYAKTYGAVDNVITLKVGDRFAQLLFVPVIKAQWEIVEEFSNNTTRATGGFGSTGY